MEQIRRALRDALGRPPSAVDCDRLARYVELLLHWNRKIRLVGPREREELVARHLGECAAAFEPRPGERIVDVGAGNGLPGLVLAVLYPTARFVLVESIAKKVAFLRAAVGETAAGNVEVLRARAEALPPAGYDAAIARAAMPVAQWLALGARLVRAGGRVVAMTREPVAASVVPAELQLVRPFDAARPGLEFVRR